MSESSSVFGDERDPHRELRAILGLATGLFVLMIGLAAIGYRVTGIEFGLSERLNWPEVATGVLLCAPLLLLLKRLLKVRFGPLAEIWSLQVDLVGPAAASAGTVRLVAIAAMAGFSEELLFRGFLQQWLMSHGIIAGLILPNVLFGLMHRATTAYAVCSFFVGLYFSVAVEFLPHTGILSAMLAHAIYDLVVLFLLASEARSIDVKHERMDRPAT